MTDTTIIVTASRQAQPLLPLGIMLEVYGIANLVWIPLAGHLRTVSMAIATNPAERLGLQKRAGSPFTYLQNEDSDAASEASERMDTLSTFLQNAPNTKLGPALKELEDASVKWHVIVVNAFTPGQIEAIRRGGGNPSDVRAITLLPEGGAFGAGSSLFTFVLGIEAKTRADFGEILAHEISHVLRDPQGNFLTEGNLPSEFHLYQDIFVSTRTGSFVGSASESAETIGGTGGDIIYNTLGNNVVNAGAGNNTIISYTGNDLLAAGSGADRYDILSSGVKAIRDMGGSDSVYLGWVRSPSDIEFSQSSGILFLDRSYNATAPADAHDRLAIVNWNDGYGVGAVEFLRFTDSGGALRSVNLTYLARAHLEIEVFSGPLGSHASGAALALDNHMVTLDPAMSSSIQGANDLPGLVLGEPQPGFVGPPLMYDIERWNSPAPPVMLEVAP